MRKKHQVIYDNGYTQAIRDLMVEINKRGELSKENLKDSVVKIVQPILERYNINESGLR